MEKAARGASGVCGHLPDNTDKYKTSSILLEDGEMVYNHAWILRMFPA